MVNRGMTYAEVFNPVQNNPFEKGCASIDLDVK